MVRVLITLILSLTVSASAWVGNWNKAIPKGRRSVERGLSDCFQTINVLGQKFDVLWCGKGCRQAFNNNYSYS